MLDTVILVMDIKFYQNLNLNYFIKSKKLHNFLIYIVFFYAIISKILLCIKIVQF